MAEREERIEKAGGTRAEASDGTRTVTVDSGRAGLPKLTLIELSRETAPAPPVLPPRYEDLGCIATGGFSEVRRVRDRQLDRAVAMKLLRAEIADAERIQARFLAEAKLTAGLEHPGIVAVHDWGRLADGRLWFTMREVRGRTLGEIIAEVHDAAGPGGVRETPSGWTFRRLIDAFARVCQAVAFAHRRGIVHRDLKPENVMVGELGEVVVMDWGLGRRVKDGEPAADKDSATLDEDSPVLLERASPDLTLHGDVLGTPAYMPPEQARGERHLHGPASDVYALGAILYHLLSGRPPYEGPASQVLVDARVGPPVPVAEAARDKGVPKEIAAICAVAMQREIADRYRDADALAHEVVAWLDGARRREQALAILERGRAIEPDIASLREEARRLREEAGRILSEVRPFEPLEKKWPGWRLEDDAKRLGVRAALREEEWLNAMEAALMLDAELPEAHAALADHYRERVLDAERARVEEQAVRAEARLRAHDRGRHEAFLRGRGALTVVTDPPGAEVFLERYVEHDRRLRPEAIGPLGRTPLRAVSLERGSYRLRLRMAGRAETLYPVLIEREEHWDGVAPGESEPHPIALPLEGEVLESEVYVPAGWAWIGGDPAAIESLPAGRVWIDGFFLMRFPVQSGDYLAMLDDLVASGREAEAIARAPLKEYGIEKRQAWSRDASGRWAPPPTWLPDLPMMQVDWYAAMEYAKYVAARTGLPFRLPNELEREKASRGADRRFLPWGNYLDPTFACVVESHRDDPSRAPVTGYPLDESPYGALGLGANMADWCINVWKRDGPPCPGGRLDIDPAPREERYFRSARGGSWLTPAAVNRSASRFGVRPDLGRVNLGIRLARSWPVTRP